ncbi:MAG: nucleoside triphosphate pyrophosphohydrolase [Deltaproteobacteria bacterium]|nr:nucleoside triphosphate pyrophosphohydrolase [Deltaproteobacteria bacterium]
MSESPKEEAPVIPAPKPGSGKLAGVQQLLDVVAALRSEHGCPWDREQNHRSLIPHLIEESYELVEAIESGNEADIREEMGDVLLQVIFHAQLAREEGRFEFDAVAGAQAEKLIERHPHVFAGESARDAEDVLHRWHHRKMKQRNSAMDGIPKTLPALSWALKVGSRAAKSGFEWRDTKEILDKVVEEVAEIREAAEKNLTGESLFNPDRKLGTAAKKPVGKPNKGNNPVDLPSEAVGAQMNDSHDLEGEFGDLLFALVQMGRWMGLDPEHALRRTVAKFITRFQWMEEAIKREKLSVSGKPEEDGEITIEQWWSLWKRAKESLRKLEGQEQA